MSREDRNISSLYFKAIVLLYIAFTSVATSSNELRYIDNLISTETTAKFTYEWDVGMFNPDDNVQSPLFSTKGIDEYNWQLQIKRVMPGLGNFSLFLQLVSSDGPVNTYCKFTWRFVDYGYPLESFMVTNFIQGETHGVNNLMAPEYRVSQTSTIQVEMFVVPSPMHISDSCEAILPVNHLHVGYNFKELFEDPLFSDMELSVKMRPFRVHKAILAAASPVFMNLFNNSQLHDKYREEDHKVDPRIFEEVLKFIYTGEIDDIEIIARDVLPIAKKYQIQPLVKLCEVTICRRLEVSNAVDTFVFAEKNKAEALQQQASLFIASNARAVIDTPAFKSIEASHPCYKILRAMVEQTKE